MTTTRLITFHFGNCRMILKILFFLQPSPLFQKLEAAQMDAFRKRFSGLQNDDDVVSKVSGQFIGRSNVCAPPTPTISLSFTAFEYLCTFLMML